MRTIKIFLFLLFAVFLFASCQKIKGPESKKDVQIREVQKKELQKPSEAKPSETKAEVQQRQEQPSTPSEAKEEKKENSVEKPKVREKELYDLEPLKKVSEAEFLKKWDELYEKFKNGTATEAEKNELLKMTYFSIEENPMKDTENFEGLSNTMNILADDYIKDIVLRPQVINVFVDILLFHRSPAARSQAAEALKKSNLLVLKEKEIIEALKEAVKEPYLDIQISAAHALMSWEKFDIALPVLDEGAKTGNTWAIAYLFKADGTLWDKRGRDILINALDYPNDEVKIVAAAELAKRGWRKETAEKKALKLLEKISKVNRWGGKERRICSTALFVLRLTKSKDSRTVPLLREIANHPDISYLQRDIKKVIEALGKKESNDEE